MIVTRKKPKADGIRYSDLDPGMVALMKGPAPPSRFISDGCSSAPDHVGPVDTDVACWMHDWSYTLGGREKDRREADANLWRNVKTVGGGWWLSALYWLEVRAYGWDHFAYHDEKGHSIKPPGMAFRVWTWFSRFGVFLCA